MRFHVLGMIAIAGAAPALAQRQQPQIVQPEISQERQEVQSGIPAGSAIADLAARLDALEAQNRSLTGQIEESENRIRQLEAALRRVEASQSQMQAAQTAARQPEPQPEPAPAPRTEPPAEQAAATPAPSERPAATSDAAERAYNNGFRLWNERRYGEAQTALEAVARDHPNRRWASWARNLAGRAYLDDNKPATAARILLENYQSNPRGERAADSLLYLGEALVRLDRRPEACRVYDELQDVYGATMRPFVRERLPQARTTARCSN